MSQKKEKENNVIVGVRIRPQNEREKSANMKTFFVPHDDGVSVSALNESGDVEENLSFNYTFGPSASNKYIFDKIGPKLVDAALEGFNSVLFMYGQTSSGKTFTLFGGQGSAGLVEYAMEQVYSRVSSSTDTEYVIKFSYAELYIEEIKDLFGTTDKRDFKIIDHPLFGPVIQDITEINFENSKQVLKKLNEVESKRHFAQTAMNDHSSRSHVIVRLTIESRKVLPGRPCTPMKREWANDEKPTLISTLNLVDLAGSESSTKSNTQGQTRKEGNAINLSLLTLGTVIAALTEKKKDQFIPYRNSNLTRLLQSALGGNAKTILITCISPAEGNRIESNNTLKFATRARLVVNAAKRNEFSGDNKSMLAKLAYQAAEIERLQQQIAASIELGFNPEVGSGQRDSLKARAVVASKNIRSLRFLLINGPKMSKSLKQNGMAHIAKKIQNDIKDAVMCRRELSGILEEHTHVLNTYLPKEVDLLTRIETVTMLNDSGIVGTGDVDDPYEGISALPEETLDSLDFGDSEEMQERLECLLFGQEEFRMTAVARIRGLEGDCADLTTKDKANAKYVNELKNTIFDVQEQVKKLTQSESVLQRTIDDMRATHQVEKDLQLHQAEVAQHKMQEVMAKLDSTEHTLQNRIHDNMSKDNEIEKLKTQCDQLNRDLNNSISSRKAYEEETTRVRQEMKGQMEKLRGNMHELLRQGGEEAKVIEIQNNDLQNQLDVTVDQLAVATQGRERLQSEVSQLRMEIAIMRDELKSREEVITVAGNENLSLTAKLRDVRLELTKCTAALNVSQQANDRMQNDIKNMKMYHEDELSRRTSEVESYRTHFESQKADLSNKVSQLEHELVSVNEQLASKIAYISKLEYSVSADTLRFDKKLTLQMKIADDLTHELNMQQAQAHAVNTRHLDEIRMLNNKVVDLQASVDAINSCVEQQQFDHDYFELEEDVYNYSDDDVSDYGSALSPVDRKKSFARGGSIFPSIDDGIASSSSTAAATSSSVGGDHTPGGHSVNFGDLTPHSTNDGYSSSQPNTPNTPMQRRQSLSRAKSIRLQRGSKSFHVDFDATVVSSDSKPRSDLYSSLASSANMLSPGNAGQGGLTRRLSIHTSPAVNSPAVARSPAGSILKTRQNSMLSMSALQQLSGTQHHSSGTPSGPSSAHRGRTSFGPAEIMAVLDTDAPSELNADLFRNILHDMTVATKKLECSVKQNALLNQFVVSQQSDASLLIQTEKMALEEVEFKEAFLRQRVTTAEDSNVFLREKELKAIEAKVKADELVRQLKAEQAEAIKAEQQAKGKVDNMEQKYLDMKLELEKLLSERKVATLLTTDLQERNEVLVHQLEEAEEHSSRLESQIALLEQDMGVLQVERDALTRRVQTQRSSYSSSLVSTMGAATNAAMRKDLILSSSGATPRKGSIRENNVFMTSKVGQPTPAEATSGYKSSALYNSPYAKSPFAAPLVQNVTFANSHFVHDPVPVVKSASPPPIFMKPSVTSIAGLANGDHSPNKYNAENIETPLRSNIRTASPGLFSAEPPTTVSDTVAVSAPPSTPNTNDIGKTLLSPASRPPPPPAPLVAPTQPPPVTRRQLQAQAE